MKDLKGKIAVITGAADGIGAVNTRMEDILSDRSPTLQSM